MVLTGGPCSGKTTALSRIRDYLVSHGYRVVILPEAATQLMGAGFSPHQNPELFQKAVLKLISDSLELYSNMLVAEGAGPRTVILCDRLYLDGKAYCTKEEWLRACASLGGLTEAVMIQVVDLVIHMVTAAEGAEEYYTLETNEHRQEDTLEKARRADERTRMAWMGHPHRALVDNSNGKGFEEKLREVIACLARRLNLPKPLEIEHKHVAEASSDEIRTFLTGVRHVTEQITQTYLVPTQKAPERRVRKTVGPDGSVRYTYTEKIPTEDPEVRIEPERAIGIDDYRRYLEREADPSAQVVRKTRRTFDYGHPQRRLQLDEMHEPVRETWYLEVELPRKRDRYELPPELLCRKVTGQKQHSMAGIAYGRTA